jgi:hypothetical protein
MRQPWCGSTPEPTKEERVKAARDGVALRQPMAPTLDGDCANVWQSVAWFKKVFNARSSADNAHGRAPPGGIAGWRPGGRNICVGLNIDGFQPFKRNKLSMSPIAFMNLNLPENLRHQSKYMLLAGIIDHKELSMDAYLETIVAELTELDLHGIDYLDPVTKKMENARVRLLFTASDYPAHTAVNKMMSHSGAHGCSKCDIVVRRRLVRR